MRMLMVPTVFMCDIHLRLEYYDVIFLAKDLNKNDFNLDILLENKRVEPQNIKRRYNELVVELINRSKDYSHYADELPTYTYGGGCGKVDKKSSLKRLMKCKRCRECMVEAMCKLSGF